MKKYIIIALLVLFAIGLLIKPLFTDSNNSQPVNFEFAENLATVWNKKINLKIKVNSDDIQKLELIYNDSIFKTWSNPQTDLAYLFNSSYFGLGTKNLILQATLTDGTIFSDERMVRVLSDQKPAYWNVSILKSMPHLTSSFTQGLEFDNGILLESTGQRGESMVAKINMSNGQIQNHISLDGTYFGEGITIINNKIFQLTWQEQKCFVYDKNSLQLLKDIDYTGEGWGLCNDGKNIIMSDGSERIVFRNPETFTIERTIEVFDDKGPIASLNELEYIDGKIYANVWRTNSIIVINPNNGKVEAIIDCTKLENEGKGLAGDVLNGIAYDKQTKKIYCTGKKWDKLFEVSFLKPGM
ncbi:MAG: glutaminyl-peptide cyclotransferase [Flavobacteriia bacterium]|nr:glutaminyl-peptide cyclotransferase [Flavobacteriia bacterium]